MAGRGRLGRRSLLSRTATNALTNGERSSPPHVCNLLAGSNLPNPSPRAEAAAEHRRVARNTGAWLYPPEAFVADLKSWEYEDSRGTPYTRPCRLSFSSETAYLPTTAPFLQTSLASAKGGPAISTSSATWPSEKADQTRVPPARAGINNQARKREEQNERRSVRKQHVRGSGTRLPRSFARSRDRL